MSAVTVLEIIGANASLKGKHEHLVTRALQELIESPSDFICLMVPPFGNEVSGEDQER